MQESKTKGAWVVLDNEMKTREVNGRVYRAAIDVFATEEEAGQFIKDTEGDFSMFYDPEAVYD